MIHVVVAIIENESGEILIARRKQEKQLGGKVDDEGVQSKTTQIGVEKR